MYCLKCNLGHDLYHVLLLAYFFSLLVPFSCLCFQYVNPNVEKKIS